MKKLTNKLTAAFLTITLILSLIIANISCIFAADTPELSELDTETAQTAEYVLSALNSAGIGIYNYKEIILILRSGIDSGDLADRYIELLNSNITHGKLIIEGSENITIYAAYLIILALHSENALDMNGSNMAAAFNNAFAAYTTAEDLNTAIDNPYYYDFIIPAVFSYAEYMEDADAIKTLLRDAIMLNYNNSENGCGIDYWGFSGDNNAAVLPALNYFSDSETIANAITDAVAFNESLIMEDGGSRFDNGEYSTVSNANSTGAALYLYSVLGNENKSLSYNGLMNFKSTITPGAYTYYGEENMYAAVDALKGLVAYRMALHNESAPFDVSKEVYDINYVNEDPVETTSESITETTLESDTETTSESITETAAMQDMTQETAAAASAKTGDNGAAVIFLLITVLSAGTMVLARKIRE